MSEQSPWGTPPPSSPTPPSFPPPGSYGGYGGRPPEPSYGGPQGTPPRKRTGLVIGLVVLVVLLTGGLTTILVLASGGSKDDSAKDDPTSQASSPIESPTSPSSPATPTSPTESSDPSDQGQITGDGYTYDLPGPGWNDASSEAASLAPSIDTIAVLGTDTDNAQSNILVEALPAGSASDVEQLAPVWKRNLSGSDNATPTPIDDIMIDGERAVGVQIDDRVNKAGVAITQVAYLALHDGDQFSIALSLPKEGDTFSRDDFEKALDSWSWTS